jgi:hypothetical protein
MSHYLPVENPRAIRAQDRAIAEHDRAWQQMRDARVEHGIDSPEYEEARAHVRETRAAMTGAAQAVRASRRWRWHVPTKRRPPRSITGLL